jgi:hypothetical protein
MDPRTEPPTTFGLLNALDVACMVTFLLSDATLKVTGSV